MTESAPTRILTLNGGSSSIKCALYESGASLRPVWEGGLERIGLPDCTFRVKAVDGTIDFSRGLDGSGFAASVQALVDWIGREGAKDGLSAVGHRVVQGGPDFFRPQAITDGVLSELRRLSPFDPEHLPGEILIIEAFRKRFPQVSHVACFDTAFHHDMPRVSRMLPIPRRYESQGLRRYGFHGLSYGYLMRELARLAGPEAARGRIILAHLGNGASLAAVREGKPMDTSMGFSPASGLVMGTRSGDLDPGLFSYLARTEGMTEARFQHMVNHESGMRGVSETGSDMRELLDREAKDERAADAVALFCYQARKWIGAFAAALGGLDTLVFSGGIGENSSIVRARICDGLGFLGVAISEERNRADAEVISAEAEDSLGAPSGRKGCRAQVRVIPTDEQIMIGRSVCEVLGRQSITPFTKDGL